MKIFIKRNQIRKKLIVPRCNQPVFNNRTVINGQQDTMLTAYSYLKYIFCFVIQISLFSLNLYTRIHVYNKLYLFSCTVRGFFPYDPLHPPPPPQKKNCNKSPLLLLRYVIYISTCKVHLCFLGINLYKI